MAKFNDLSVDLIYVIFSHLQSDKAQLHNLALSSHLFRDIAQRFIVRDASISHSVNGSRSKLFLRTLTERPDLVAHVHRLELDLLREDIHWPEEQQTIHQIMRRLTNLRDFCYLSRDYKVWHYSVPQPLKWGREHAHDQVRRVEWHHNMAPWELQKCMALPRIELIYVRELQDPSSGRFTLFKLPARKHKTSTLTELRVGSPDSVACQSLKLLLHAPIRMKKITFECRGVYQSVIEPTALVRMLEPVSDTLEELSVEISNMLGPPRQPANLSAFVSLRKLSLPFRYVFGQGAEAPYPADAHLPPYLHELEMAFVAAPQATLATRDRALQKNHDTLVDWLRTIDGQDEAPRRMPLLTSVTVQQTDKTSPLSDLCADIVKKTIEEWKSQSCGLPEDRLNLVYVQ